MTANYVKDEFSKSLVTDEAGALERRRLVKKMNEERRAAEVILDARLEHMERRIALLETALRKYEHVETNHT